MKKFQKCMALILAVIMLVVAMPAAAFASILDNSPEYNEEILKALEEVVGSEDEAKLYYEVLENYGLLDEDGSIVDNMHATIDGVEYSKDELCELLSGNYDGNKIAEVDGMQIKLDDLWNIIVIEGYIDYLRETYYIDGEWTKESEESFQSFLTQFTTSGVNLTIDEDPILMGSYSGLNHGALVSFKASSPVNNVVTVTAALSAAEPGQEVSFEYDTLSASAKVEQKSGSVRMLAGNNGTAEAKFNVTLIPEKVDQLIAENPVWVLNVHNLKNALFAESGRNAASISFTAPATVGDGKEIEGIYGTFTKSLDDGWLRLSAGQKYAINKGYINTVREKRYINMKRNCLLLDQRGLAYKGIDMNFKVRIDSSSAKPIYENGVHMDLQEPRNYPGTGEYEVTATRWTTSNPTTANFNGAQIKTDLYVNFSANCSYPPGGTLEFGDAIKPTVFNIYTPKSEYTVGNKVPIVVTFSEPMQADGASITVNGTKVNAIEKGRSNKLTFMYPVKEVDSSYPYVTAVNAKDASGNQMASGYQPNPGVSEGLMMSNAHMTSCLAEDSFSEVFCEIDNSNPAAPLLNVNIKLSSENARINWLASDLGANGVSGSLFAAVEGSEKTAFKLQGENFTGATLTASIPVTVTERTRQFTVELYRGNDLMIGKLYYTTQEPALYIASEDLTVSTLVKANDGALYQYSDPADPVIYLQDSPVISAAFTVANKGFVYADTKLVTTIGADGHPADASAHFAWKSSDASVANIDAKGNIVPSGKSGSVYFTLVALNGNDEKAVSVDTDVLKFDAGLAPYLSIPNKNIKTVAETDVTLFWSSNIIEKIDNAQFSVTVKDSEGNTVFETATNTCGVTIPASELKYDYDENADNSFTVNVSIEYGGSVYEDGAIIVLSSAPAVIKLDTLTSYYLIDTESSVDINWTIKNFDRYSGSEADLFKLYITKNNKPVEQSTVAGSGSDGVYSGSYKLDLSDVITNSDDPTSYRDIYTVSIQAKNGSDSTWSYDSCIIYVYDENALKLWVNGEETNGSISMSNLPAISAMDQDQILELKRDITLHTVVSANYGDYAWTDLSDRIAWKSSDPTVADLNYNQGSYYASTESYTYTSYRPASEFLLAGLSDGDAQITETHVNTGLTQTLNVNVESLKNKLYLFSCIPAVKTTITYTNGLGEEKTAESNDSGEFAIYEESGIASDVYFDSVYEGLSYYGTYFENAIVSGEPDPCEASLYPCNNLVLRRAAYAAVYLKNPDGTPYVGDVVVRSGVFVNEQYIDSAMFSYTLGEKPSLQGEEDCVASTDENGKLTVIMDSTQWGLNELAFYDSVEYEFVVKKAASTEYYPLFIRIDASENEENYIRSGESIARFRRNSKDGEHPFVLAANVVMRNNDLNFSANENILDSTASIGVSQQIQREEITLSVLWWGIDVDASDDYSMSLFTDERYEISGENTAVTSDSITFAEAVVTTVTVPFDTEIAKACNIGAEAKGLELRYQDITKGLNLSEELSFRIADTTDTPLTPDAVVGMVGNINNTFDMTQSNACGSINMNDNIMSLVVKHFASENYSPDKDHANGFSMQIMPTKDPTVFIAYLGLGLSNMTDRNVTGVYADGSRDEKFSYLPGFKEVKWFFSGEDGGEKYVNAYEEDFKKAEQRKFKMEYYYNVTGYLESRLVYDETSGLWDIHVLSGGFDAGGGVGFVKYINTWVGPVPVTAELRGAGTVNVSLDTLTMQYLTQSGEIKSGSEFLTQLRIYFYFKFFGGVGFDYSVVALKIGLYGQIDADLTLEWLNRPDMPQDAKYPDGKKIDNQSEVLSGQYIKVGGQVGIEFVAKFLFFSYEKALYSYRFTAYEKAWNGWNAINSLWNKSQDYYHAMIRDWTQLAPGTVDGDVLVLDLAPTTMKFDYLDSSISRGWNSNTLAPILKLGAVSDTNANAMLTNANPYTSPMLSDDGNVLLYLSDESNDGTVHAAYALKDASGYQNGGRICDFGNGDTGNVIAGTKDFAVAAWSTLGVNHNKEAGAIVTPEEQIIMIDSSEVYASVFNGDQWITTALTSNATADVSPVVAVSGDRAIVAWRAVATSNVNGNISDFNANDTILYKLYDGMSWSEETYSLYNGTSGNVKALNTAMLEDGTAAVIYVVDTDGSDETYQDREILWAVIDNESGEVSRTIRATNDEAADENPQISATSINGEPCFVAAWYTSSNDGGEVKYDIHMADFGSDGVMYGRLPQSLEKMINDKNVLVTSDFRFTKGSDTIDDLALVWVERVEKEGESEGLTVECDLLNSLKFYTYGGDSQRIGITSAQQLVKAPASTLINNFDVACNDNTAVSVFLGTTYDSDETETKVAYTVDGQMVEYDVPFSYSTVFTAKGEYVDALTVSNVYVDSQSLHLGAAVPMVFTVVNDGINPITSLTLDIAGSVSEKSGLLLMPGESTNIYASYKPSDDTICNVEYTVTAETTEGTAETFGTTDFEFEDLEITSAKVIKENEGKRTIEIKLNNNSDTKLAGSGKAVGIHFYGEPSYSAEMTGAASSFMISDDASLALIDKGGFSTQVVFDLYDCLESLGKTTDLTEEGMTLYIKAIILEDDEEYTERNTANNKASVVFDNLEERSKSTVKINAELFSGEPLFIPGVILRKNLSSQSVVTATVRNNKMFESTSGNVVATLLDANGNVIEQKSFENNEVSPVNLFAAPLLGGPDQTDSQILSLAPEETKEVSFEFDGIGSYVDVAFIETSTDEKDSSLAQLEATNIPGLDLSKFIKDVNGNTYRANLLNIDADEITLLVSPSNANGKVTLNGQAIEGYTSKALSNGKNTFDFVVTSTDGTTSTHYILTVTKGSEPEYYDGPVVITPKKNDDVKACKKDANCPLSKFIDLDLSRWYHDGIHYCVSKELMNGTGEETFEPGETITRAEIVTMLWRLAGKPVVNYLMMFEDVEPERYYTEAIRWAASEKIAGGYSSDSFGPNDEITREELATMLYRYAKKTGVDTDKIMENVNTLSYEDIFEVSKFATAGMNYCIAAGVINGADGCIYPHSTATRAEAATMLQRYCK